MPISHESRFNILVFYDKTSDNKYHLGTYVGFLVGNNGASNNDQYTAVIRKERSQECVLRRFSELIDPSTV